MKTTAREEAGAARIEGGIRKALAGLPPRVLKTALTVSESLRAVVCEVGRSPQLWTSGGKAVVLAGECSQEEVERAIQAMAPWGEDGVSGVDGELHFRMLLTSSLGTRGVIVYIHHHTGTDPQAVGSLIKAAIKEQRDAVLLIGRQEHQEHVLRDACRIAATVLGVSTVLVDPSGRIGGRGRVPDTSIGSAVWIPTRDVSGTSQTLLAHARPRVLVTAADRLGGVAELLPHCSGVLLVAGTPVQSADLAAEELVELASSYRMAAIVAHPDRVEALPDLMRAAARWRR